MNLIHFKIFSSGHVDVVNFLIEHGADVNVKNERGQTPRDLAIEEGIVINHLLILN